MLYYCVMEFHDNEQEIVMLDRQKLLMERESRTQRHYNKCKSLNYIPMMDGLTLSAACAEVTVT